MFTRVKNSLFALYTRARSLLSKLSTKQKIIAGTAVVIVLIIAVTFLTGSKPSEGNDLTAVRSVSLLKIDEYASNLPPLSLIGTVRSQSEASITAETQGVVSRVYYSLGDFVSAGSIVAELENASQRAGLLQAQAARDVALANLDKIKRGTRDEQLSVLIITRDNAQSALRTAELSAENAIRSSYATLADAIQRHIDATISNPNSNQPSFIPQTSNTQLEIDVESMRPLIQIILNRHSSVEESGVFPALDTELSRLAQELASARDFVTNVISALNSAIPTSSVSETQIAAWRADANTALSSINTSRSTILTTIDTLASRRSSLEIAEKNLEQGQTGGQLEDIQAAEASLRQAEASVLSAQASFQKTLLRAPISGTLETMDLERGQFVPALSSIARIANINALEIIAFASQNDLPYLQIGAEVTINSGVSGVVTRVAPSLDPSTKRIEVRIGVQEEVPLTNGQSTEIAIARTTTNESIDIRIPLSAIKVTADSSFVFSLNDDSTLHAHPVTIESILGNDVVITGVSPTLTIIKDARGLKDGEKVRVQ